MKRTDKAMRGTGLWAAAALRLLLSSAPAGVAAQSMGDYTNFPLFLSQAVPPNILFLVDMGTFTLEAAYSGTNHKYPISFKTGTATSLKYASNVTIDSQSGDDLVAVDTSGGTINTSDVTSPASLHLDQIVLRDVRSPALLHDRQQQFQLRVGKDVRVRLG